MTQGHFMDRTALTRIGARELDGYLRGWRDEDEPGPAYLALARRLRTLILDGRVPVHTVLPSERVLAEALGTSRTTTTAAYRVLRESGFAAGRHGSGTWTTLPGTPRQEPWPVLHGEDLPEEIPDLTTASFEAPPGLHPAYQAALAELPRYLPGHGDLTAGVPELRARVAQRYTDRGLPTRPEQVLVTTGATQAIQLTFQALLNRGDRVLVEHPTWPLATQSAQRLGARPVPFPVEDGWDPLRLRALLSRSRPTLAYLIPDFHNPTGLLLNGPERLEVARALADTGTTVLVDETTTDLDLRAGLGRDSGPMPAPLAALARRGTAVSVGSASKLFWGGLRVGWVRADTEL
ncbi:MAG: PLP-dependent aminotransferase family protein, partial [Kineosporiaceae bacterium]